MGIAAAAASAEVRDQNSGWLPPGQYGLLQVTHLKEHEDRLFIAEMDVLESEGEQATKAGQDGSFCVDCVKFKGSMAGDVKVFLAALTKTPVEDIDKDGIEASYSTAQPCVGMLVKAKAWSHTTKNDKIITKYKFYPATDDDAKRAGALRQKLGMSPLAVVA